MHSDDGLSGAKVPRAIVEACNNIYIKLLYEDKDEDEAFFDFRNELRTLIVL